MDDKEVTLEDELLLHAYLDGELSPAQRDQVAARLAVEPAFAAVYEKWRYLLAEIGDLPEPRLARDLTAGVLQRLEPVPAASAPFWRPLLLGQTMLALLLALLAWPLWVVLPAFLPRWSLPDWPVMAQAWLATLAGWESGLERLVFFWQGMQQGASLSLSLLLPLGVGVALLWLMHLRFLWRSAPFIK